MKNKWILCVLASVAGSIACANDQDTKGSASMPSTAAVQVQVFELQEKGDGKGKLLGTIVLNDTKEGLSITPDLKGLSKGTHGIHIHENPNCGTGDKDGKRVLGLAAGGHFDPEKTGIHKGPHQDEKGHLGDLPALEVNDKGIANKVMVAPKLTLSQVNQRSIIIHENGDNYSDLPEKLGGGGPRLACGIIKF